MPIEIAFMPYDAALGAEIDEIKSTSVNEGAGGVSTRWREREDIIREFNMTVGPDYSAEVADIHATHARMVPCAVRSWNHYQLLEEECESEAADGVVTITLTRTRYPATGNLAPVRVERILIPDENETQAILYMNGEAVDRDSWDFVFPGYIEIDESLWDSGAVASVTMNYMWPACFLDDALTSRALAPGVISLPEVRMRSILEEELLNLTADWVEP